MADFNFNFNLENFGLGLATGWATAYALYRARGLISSARDTVSERAASAQYYATRSADSRYIEDLLRACENEHLAGKAVKLSEIVIEPRFLPAPSLAAPIEDDVVRSVFHVVPHVPDFPYLQAPYNAETLSIEDLGRGDHAIALLGLPGSGRTTALYTIALWSLGKVNFKPPLDKVQLQLEKEEAELSNDDRVKRVKERLNIEEMAKQSLARRKESDVDMDAESRRKAAIPLFNRLTPIYAHLANIRYDTGEFGRQVDPAEPLVRAVQRHVRSATSKTIPRNLYERLAEGKALLLLDGYDELPESERPRILAWIKALLDEYGNNYVIVTGPATGYGGLTRVGLAPMFLRPWSDVDMNRAADLWADAWPQISGKRKSRPEEEAVERAQAKNRAFSPFDLTIKLWSTYESEERADYESWMRAMLDAYLPNSLPMGIALPQIAKVAALQLDEGFITAQRLEQILLAQSRIPDALSAAADDQAAVTTEDFDAAIDEQSDEDLSEFEDNLNALTEDEVEPGAEIAAAPPKDTKSKEKKPSKSKDDKTGVGKEVAGLLSALTKSRLLLRFRGGRYLFRHPLIAAYLVSLALKEMDEAQMLEKVGQPTWEPAFAYAAIHTPVDAAVRERMEAPADVLQNNLLELSRWLAYAGAKVEWRNALFRQLGNMFVAANQYPLIRERIAAALITTRDKNVGIVFKRGLKHADPDVRRLSCLALGALRDEETIPNLSEMLADPVADVQLAAGLALGAIGTEAALDEMVGVLTSGTEQLRQAVSEAFAAIPDAGYPILYEAVNHDEMMLRRAAVFGLRRINTPWALTALYRASLEDDQWYVRSAAEQAFHDMQYGDLATGPKKYPPIEAIPWLREWIGGQGEEVIKSMESPDQMLLMALQDGDPQVQMLSVANMGQLGLASHVSLLYTALRHQQDHVRDAAFRSLAAIQEQMGHPLPAPI